MISFGGAVSFVSVDFITDDSSDPARLEVYDALGNLLEAVETPGAVGFAGVETARINRFQNDVSYVVAGGITSQAVYIDHVQYARAQPVPEVRSIAGWGCGFGALARLMRRKPRIRPSPPN
jgi:hypothetical protein